MQVARTIRESMKRVAVRSRFLRLGALLLLSAANLSCAFSGGSGQPVAKHPAFANASAPLITPTYDGSGQAMHPGIVFIAGGWHGFSYWLIVDPYPNYDATLENPSILVSNDGITWQVPPGLTNPIAAGGPLADGDLFYDAASDQLWAYYIRSVNSPAPATFLERKVSSDGVNWSSSEDVLSMPKNALLSPAVIKIGDTYHLWYVNAYPAGWDSTSSTVEHRTSSDGKNWSAAVTCQISQPGYVIWHLDIIPVQLKNSDSGTTEDKQWMLASAFPVGGNSGGGKLFFADSSNTVDWITYPQPVLGPGSGWDAGEIYRSTLLYDPATDLIRIWYSAKDAGTTTAPGVKSYVWHTGYTEMRYADLRAWLSQ